MLTYTLTRKKVTHLKEAKPGYPQLSSSHSLYHFREARWCTNIVNGFEVSLHMPCARLCVPNCIDSWPNKPIRNISLPQLYRCWTCSSERLNNLPDTTQPGIWLQCKPLSACPPSLLPSLHPFWRKYQLAPSVRRRWENTEETPDIQSVTLIYCVDCSCHERKHWLKILGNPNIIRKAHFLGEVGGNARKALPNLR